MTPRARLILGPDAFGQQPQTFRVRERRRFRRRIKLRPPIPGRNLEPPVVLLPNEVGNLAALHHRQNHQRLSFHPAPGSSPATPRTLRPPDTKTKKPRRAGFVLGHALPGCTGGCLVPARHRGSFAPHPWASAPHKPPRTTKPPKATRPPDTGKPRAHTHTRNTPTLPPNPDTTTPPNPPTHSTSQTKPHTQPNPHTENSALLCGVGELARFGCIPAGGCGTIGYKRIQGDTDGYVSCSGPGRCFGGGGSVGGVGGSVAFADGGAAVGGGARVPHVRGRGRSRTRGVPDLRASGCWGDAGATRELGAGVPEVCRVPGPGACGAPGACGCVRVAVAWRRGALQGVRQGPRLAPRASGRPGTPGVPAVRTSGRAGSSGIPEAGLELARGAVSARDHKKGDRLSPVPRTHCMLTDHCLAVVRSCGRASGSPWRSASPRPLRASPRPLRAARSTPGKAVPGPMRTPRYPCRCSGP